MIVVKVGGSLYDHPQLGPGLRAYLDSLGEPVLVVPGGGSFADAVRKLDALHHLSEGASHDLALQTMDLAGNFLKSLGISATILNAVEFESDLPHSWNVTSDSIAARAAIVHRATRLVLLKSIDIPVGTSWVEAAERGWVDPHFPIIARSALRSEDSASRLIGRVLVEAINFRRVLDAASLSPR